MGLRTVVIGDNWGYRATFGIVLAVLCISAVAVLLVTAVTIEAVLT